MSLQLKISIHAPLAGCDPGVHRMAARPENFNPRTPCGVRPLQDVPVYAANVFQSTHPLRGATKRLQNLASAWQISIHAPLAGCDVIAAKNTHNITNFNPRTPCGVRRRRKYPRCRRVQFQSTHPLRGATPHEAQRRRAHDISIHAPLAGCDGCQNNIFHKILHFNPRTPCGVRLQREYRDFRKRQFQSTHPLRGATRDDHAYQPLAVISIHAPLAGCDAGNGCCFEPIFISIHAPLAGCDDIITDLNLSAKDFNPRTPCGVRPQQTGKT